MKRFVVFAMLLVGTWASAAELRLLPIKAQDQANALKTEATPQGLKVTVSSWVPCQASYKGLLVEKVLVPGSDKTTYQVRAVGEYLGDIVCALPGFYIEESLILGVTPNTTYDFLAVQPAEGTWPNNGR